MKWTPDNSYLLQYKAEIDQGHIIVGQELYMELLRLADDMAQEPDLFNPANAHARMDFMEGCIRLTKSPFYGKPMELMLFQKAFIETLYGFKMPEGVDRFKKALLMIARKNGKSELSSGLCNAEFITGPDGADLVCSSNDDAQASIVYDAVDLMRQLYDPNDADTKRNQRFILNRANNTKVFKLSDRTRNKEGRNIDWSILDEAHEMKDNTIAKSIEQSQSLKLNPKLIIITTEGFVSDGYLDQETEFCRKIINGEDDSLAGFRYLPWLYTQDSETEIFQNPRSWYKSNPTLGHIKRLDYLEEQVDLAKRSKADRIFVLSKDFNIKQNAAKSWLDPSDYDYPATFDLEDFRGGYCLGEVDLSETTDLTCAKALLMRPGDGTKYIATQYFIPESKLDPSNDDHEQGARYKEWADAGYITISEGNEIDLSLPATWFYTLARDYNIRLLRCGYDQRFARSWLTAMEEYGWSKKYGDVEMILQNAPTLSNAISLVEMDLKSRRINYNENPVDRWCFKNACLQLNTQRQALIVKANNRQKIDGAVTLASLYELYRRYKTEYAKAITQTGG